MVSQGDIYFLAAAAFVGTAEAGEAGPLVGVVGLAAAATGVGVGAAAATGALDAVVVVVVVPVLVGVVVTGAEPSALSSVKATLITNSLPSAVFFSPVRPFFLVVLMLKFHKTETFTASIRSTNNMRVFYR